MADLIATHLRLLSYTDVMKERSSEAAAVPQADDVYRRNTRGYNEEAVYGDGRYKKEMDQQLIEEWYDTRGEPTHT